MPTPAESVFTIEECETLSLVHFGRNLEENSTTYCVTVAHESERERERQTREVEETMSFSSRGARANPIPDN